LEGVCGLIEVGFAIGKLYGKQLVGLSTSAVPDPGTPFWMPKAGIMENGY
jgi:hypothetical protein